MKRISIYISNLGKFNEGILIGKWIRLPVPMDKLNAALARIGINDQYQEYFITDWESSLANLEINEFTSISEVNELAEQLEALSDWDYEKLAAVLEAESPTSVAGILALIQELDDFDLIPEIEDEADLGEYYAEECCILSGLPEVVQRYFDFAAYGRDIHLEGRGIFTSWGYVEDNRW